MKKTTYYGYINIMNILIMQNELVLCLCAEESRDEQIRISITDKQEVKKRGERTHHRLKI